MSITEYMERPAAERKLIDEVNRINSLVTMLNEWLNDSRSACDNVRRQRDDYARQLGLANDWDVAESVREKYDPREELEEALSE